MAGEVLEGFNAEALTLRVQGLERWRDVEQRLRARGFTLGWAPALSSRETVGELLEARAEGLRSCLYGDLAACCIAVEAVLANGQPVASKVVPRSAAGPDWKHLLLGGQGLTGRISAATLRVFRAPELEIPAAYDFLDMEGAFRAAAAVIHHGAIPAVGAILSLGAAARLLVTFEGSEALSRARAAIAERICTAGGGVSIGTQPVRDWIDGLGGSEATGRVESPLLLQPTVRVDAPWRDLPALAGEIRAVPRARWCVTHLRHAAAAILVEGPLEAGERERLLSRLEAAGGHLPSAGPAAGPVGARLVGEPGGSPS